MAKLAIAGGEPITRTPLEVSWPIYDHREKELLMDVLESRNWGGYPAPSPRAAEFGAKFAKYHGATSGVCVTNGSITLEAALIALGIEAGDEVITPCYTWVATAACAVHQNAVPVMLDVAPDSYCIDPDLIEAAITPRTRGIIPVHLGANMADMDRIMQIAEKHGLWVMEDCAHAHGAAWRGRGAGSIGDVGSFSFQRSKLMTSGEGGVLITSNAELAQKMQSVVNCGRKEPGYDAFDGDIFGINARLTEFQAAILIAQLERLEASTTLRAANVRYLTEELAKIGGITPLPHDPRISTRAAYQLVMKYDANHFGGVHRDRFLAALLAEGVDFDGPFYVPLPDHELFNARSAQWPMLRPRYGDGISSPESRAKHHFPVAHNAAYNEAIWVHYPYLMASREHLDRLLAAILKIRDNIDELRESR